MLKNTWINRQAAKRIALALDDLNEWVVYVGGAVVSLYIDDPAAEDVRPTKDIDISMEIASLTELETIRQELSDRGFVQSSEDSVICRFRYADIKVDVMATKEIGWASANTWFAPGFRQRIPIRLDETTIYCLPLPYFLASKFEAFYNRGGIDPRTSHDFEDLVYLFNHSSTIKEEVLKAEDSVRLFLSRCCADILSDGLKQEAILANLFHENQDLRYQIILNTLRVLSSAHRDYKGQ